MYDCKPSPSYILTGFPDQSILRSKNHEQERQLFDRNNKNDFIPLIINHQQSRVARTHHKPRHTELLESFYVLHAGGVSIE